MFNNHKNEIERQIVVCLVEDALAAGYKLGVNDGEETTLIACDDAKKIFAAMSSTDEDYLLYWPPGSDCKEGYHRGWVRLIYGNDADVISDNSTLVPESLLARAEALAERFAQ